MCLFFRVVANLIESISILRNYFAYICILHFIRTVIVYVKIYVTARKSILQIDKMFSIIFQEESNEASTTQEIISKSSSHIEKQRCNKRNTGEIISVKINEAAVTMGETSSEFINKNIPRKGSSSSKYKNNGKTNGVFNHLQRNNRGMDGRELSQYCTLQIEACALKIYYTT